MAAISLQGVTKRYRRRGLRRSNTVTALRDVDLTVEAGEIFGFLGPNGAGKSTTIDILLDYVAATEGSVRVLGHEVPEESVEVRQRTGVLPDGYGPIGERTGREHVEFAIEAKGADDDPDELLARVGMRGPDAYPVEQYSKGMAQRLLLATALVGEPDLLILDEPTTGLDPNGARTMREIVREENDRGATVFFSSHIMEQVEAVCDRVAILDAGELVTVDSIENLRRRGGAGSTITLELSGVDDAALDRVRDLEGVRSIRMESAAMRAVGGATPGSGASSGGGAAAPDPGDGSAAPDPDSGDGATVSDSDTGDGATITVACEDRAKAAVIATLYDSDAAVRNVTTDETSLEELFASFTEGVA